jgi:hypothetical protein
VARRKGRAHPDAAAVASRPWLADIRDFLKAEAAGARATTAGKASADGKRAAEESQTAGSAQRRRR